MRHYLEEEMVPHVLHKGLVAHLLDKCLRPSQRCRKEELVTYLLVKCPGSWPEW